MSIISDSYILISNFFILSYNDFRDILRVLAVLCLFPPHISSVDKMRCLFELWISCDNSGPEFIGQGDSKGIGADY